MYTNKQLQEVINYLKENEELFNDLIEDLDDWMGYLGDERCWDMDTLDELVNSMKISEFAESIRGNHFDVYDNYFRGDVWNGIESCAEKDYSHFLDECFIDEVLEYRDRLHIEDDILNLLLDEVEKSF